MEYKLEDGELVVVSGEWPTNNIDAIKECIKKFEVINGYLEAGEKVHNTGGAKTCALCQMYHSFYVDSFSSVGCSSLCPIKKKTGFGGCVKTPYDLIGGYYSIIKIKDVDKEIEFLNEVLE